LCICTLFTLLALFSLSCSAERRGYATKGNRPVIALRVYSWDNEYAITAATESFNKVHKEIHAELVTIPWKEYQNRLFVALTSGEDIDVYFMREVETFAGYVKKGLAYPLDDLIAKHGIDLGIYGTYAQQIRSGGRVFALPYRGAGFYLYYNVDAFRLAGIALPDGRWTWAKYRQVAKALTSGAGARKRFGSFMEPSFYYLPLIPALQAGVRIVDDDFHTDLGNPAVRRALLFYRALVDDGSQPTLAYMKANNLTTTSAFVSGEAAMVMAGDFFVGRLNSVRRAGELPFPWGMTRIPCDRTMYADLGLATTGCVNADSRKIGAAFTYLSWIAGIEGQKVIAAAGSKPAIITPETEDILAERMGLDADERSVFFEIPPKIVNEPINLGATYAKQILDEELTAFFTGSKGIDDTISESIVRLDAALAEFR
jgi:ABC-type glycerol-3-phosphate transport system substrate-binding protein